MKRKKLYLITAIILLIIVSIFIANKNNTCKKEDNSVCKIEIDDITLKLKVAYSKKAQEQGLMWVKELDDNSGMIFVYDEAKPLAFWMKNTPLPLSIAFIEPDGKISVIYDMYPEPNKEDKDLAIYPSRTPTQYAIEVPLGWFSIHNIKKNSYIKIPKELL